MPPEIEKMTQYLDLKFSEIVEQFPDGSTIRKGLEAHHLEEIRQALLSTYLAGIEEGKKVDENTSDGYHTFKELYEFRLLYNAHLFNEWAAQDKYDVHKSQRHNDGELCFGRDDYFVVVATLPTGQISNHYPMSDWDLFKCEAVEKAKSEWDGHTSQDVATRLREALSQKEAEIKEQMK